MTKQAIEGDRIIANMVHGICAHLPPYVHGITGKPTHRYGRKCFVSAVWRELVKHSDQLTELDIPSMRDFKLWLLDAMRLVDPDGVPLILLARADLVGAMDRSAVAASEIEDRGATYHFIIDRAAGAEDYVRLKR